MELKAEGQPQAVQTAALATLANEATHDRIVGTIIGSALGDAIGLYTEFLSREKSLSVYPSGKFTLSPASEATAFHRDFHRMKHIPGEWTDDTDHAILILLGYLHNDGKELNTHDLAERLVQWCQFGIIPLNTLPLGLGATVGSIVRSGVYLDGPEAKAREHWKAKKCDIAPNGSLMRTHPVGLMCLQKRIQVAFWTGVEYSLVTHVDPRCLISCAIGTALVRGLVKGEIRKEQDVDDILEKALTWWVGYRAQMMEKFPERREEPDLDLDLFWKHAKVDGLEELELDDPAKMGYVYKTFGAGIHLLRLAMRKVAEKNTMSVRASVFETLITDLTMQGGDADTNACFAGSLLGAYLGYGALPAHWKHGLRHGEWLMDKAESLAIVAGAKEGVYSGLEDKDTAQDGGRGRMPTKDEMDGLAAHLMARIGLEDKAEKEKAEKAEKEKKRKSRWQPW